jgi:ankyrin repeat protein
LQTTDDSGYSALFHAVLYGHASLVKILLGFGVDPNCLEAGGKGFSPLMAAAEAGHELVVQSLVRMGADVNYANVLGETAKTVAAKERIHFGAV